MSLSRLVLVTGGSGAVGGRLIEVLRARGWRVRALVHRESVATADAIVRGDLSTGEGLREAVTGADAIVHVAAVTHARDARRYEQVNVDGTRRLLNAAAGVNVGRLVHISTRAIAMDGGAYSRSKARAEELVRQSGPSFTIVRLPEVFGGEGSEGVDRIVSLARRGRAVPVVGSGNQELCPVLIDDAIGAVVAALDAPEAGGRTYTLAGQCVTMREFARLALATFGQGGRIVPVPIGLLALLGLASRFVPLPAYPDQLARLRASKPPLSPAARDDLGFAPLPLEQALRTLHERAA